MAALITITARQTRYKTLRRVTKTWVTTAGGVGQFETKCLPTIWSSPLEVRQNSLILFVINQEHTCHITKDVIRPLVQKNFKIKQNMTQLSISTVRPRRCYKICYNGELYKIIEEFVVCQPVVVKWPGQCKIFDNCTFHYNFTSTNHCSQVGPHSVNCNCSVFILILTRVVLVAWWCLWGPTDVVKLNKTGAVRVT